MTEIEKIKSLIRSVLLSEPEGVPMHRLRRDYEEVTCSSFPLKNLGYHSVEEMCYALNDVIRVQQVAGSYLLFAVSDARTEHVEKLIANQRKKKKPHNTVNRGSMHFNGCLPHHRFRTTHTRFIPTPQRAPTPQRHVITTPHPQKTSYSDVPIRPTPHPQKISYSDVPIRPTPHPQKISYSDIPIRHTPTANPVPTHATSKPARSVWDRLGKPLQIDTSFSTKDRPASLFSQPPRRVSSSEETTTILSPSHPVQKGSWILPSNSSPWRYQYSEARTASISELATYANRPRELILVEGYFLGQRQALGDRVLRSGRKLNTAMLKFPLHHTTSATSPSVTCTFSFPDWALSTYNSPNELAEGSKLKIYGELYTLDKQHAIAVQYFNVFLPNSETPTVPDTGIEFKMSSLAIEPPAHQNSTTSTRRVDSVLSNYSSEASDTSVYTDSDKNTTEGDESPDLGYSSPIPAHPNSDFPHSSSLNRYNVPKEFTSRVACINDLRHFYLSINSDSDTSLKTLTSTLTNYHQSLNQPPSAIPTECKDLLCSAFHQDSHTWHRAKFLKNSSPSSSHFSILFIDLGEEIDIPSKHIRSFPVQFMQLRAQTILCSLPLPHDLATDPHLITLFRTLVSNVPLKTRLLIATEADYQVDITVDSSNVVSEIMSAATNRLHINTSIPSPSIPPSSPLFSPTLLSPTAPPMGYSYSRGGAITSNPPVKLSNELRTLISYESLPSTISLNPFPVKITSIISPDKFYIQNHNKKQALAELTSSIQFYCKANKQEQSSPVPVMEYCLAECQPGDWARVQVISWNPTSMEARVFLLDYGLEKTVPLKNLLKLTGNHLRVPFQAISVKLNGVSPLAESWSERALSYFRSLTLNKVMWACHKRTNSLLLVITGDGPDVCIHEKLITGGLARASN